MKINNINNQTSFGRAIKVTEHRETSGHNKKSSNSLAVELKKVLNSEPSKIYNEQEAQSIRAFFMTTLGDYNGKDNIKLRYYKNNAILISGKDSKAIKDIEQKFSNRKKQQNKVEHTISKRLEDGSNGKPITSLHIYEDKTKPNTNRCSQIRYQSENRNYTCITDGFVREDIEPVYLYDGKNKAQNFTFEQKDLYFN